ncbi:MAG: T9SS type A sorting domain-containing protein, partial [Bacteroidia bacterium]
GSVTLYAETGNSPGQHYQWIRNNQEMPGQNARMLKVSEEGEYQLKCSSEGCSGWSAPEKIVVNTALTAKITAGGHTGLCMGDSVILYANSCDGYIYQWKKDDEDLPGETRSTFVARNAGDYQVKIISGQSVAWSAPVTVDSEPCDELAEDSNNPLAITDNATAEPYSDAFKVLVYPNPTTGRFSVDINLEDVNGSKTEIKVINSVGQVIYTKSIAANEHAIRETIELENSLPTGIYFLQVNTGVKSETIRLVLNR